MAKWLEQLRKNSETAPRGTLKTLKTHIGEVSKVLRVSSKAVSEKFPPDEETGLGGFEGFEGTPPERLRNYSGKKSENAPEAHPQNRQNPHCDHCKQHGETLEISRSGFDVMVHRWCLDDWERAFDERWPP
jgi:hypothetical protein